MDFPCPHCQDGGSKGLGAPCLAKVCSEGSPRCPSLGMEVGAQGGSSRI